MLFYLENINNGSYHIYLNFISLASIISGLLVIISKNPIVSVLFLISLFFAISGYLMMLGLNFIGLSYLLVYVGAVSILFLFILMLINVRISELVSDTSDSLTLAILIGVVFNSIIYTDNIVSLYDDSNKEFTSFEEKISNTSLTNLNENIINNLSLLKNKTINGLNYVSSNTWDGALAENNHISTLGNVIYTTYPIWLIITSIILLLAMVGAIVITIRQKG